MSILPSANIDLTELVETDNAQRIIRDYKIENGHIKGYVTGLDAVKQACYKAISTERFAFSAYNFNYGIELQDLIGQSKDFVSADLKRRFEECLEGIKGYLSVGEFNIVELNDGLKAEIEIQTEYGNVLLEQEVIT